MKLLHTSDWHLGQFFMGKSRQREHSALITWLVAQAQKHQVDALIIAGDIFDTGAPPSYARELYNQLIVELQALNMQLIVLAGNHDSVSVLEESKTLLSHMNTQVMACPPSELREALLTINNPQGEAIALLCAIPYLRARDLLISQAGQSAKEKQQALQDAIKQHYQALFDEALIKRAEIKQTTGKTLPIIATGHLTAVGASRSESVREIYVGSLEAFPSNAFPPADYIALGHIHQAQKVGGREHIRYSGSPIALSFDEVGQKKQLLLVELSEAGLSQITTIEIPVFQAMASVKGNLQELSKAIPNLCQRLCKEGTEQRLWLEVIISDDDYLSDLQQRLESICQELPCDILRLRRERPQGQAALEPVQKETLDELSSSEVFLRRLASESLEPAQEIKLIQLYKQVLSKVEQEPAK